MKRHPMSDRSPLIRAARASDLPHIRAIYSHYVETSVATFETAQPDLAEMTRRFDGLRARGFPYLVGEIDGEIVGYAYAGTYRSRAAYDYAVEDSVYVAHDRQGHGIGRTLLSALIERCTALGYRRMVAVIGDSANHASINLHLALGFSHAGVLPSVGYKLGRWVDSVTMQRALGEGDSTPPRPISR